VLNRVALAMPQLPDVVRATGVTTRKRSPEILMTYGLSSPDGRYDQLYMSNYAVLHLKEELQRLPGVSDVTIFGQRDYAMRVWVDPARLAVRNLTAADVVRALREQNVQVTAGQIGQPPTADGQPIQVTLSALGRLSTVEEFEGVVVKVGDDRQVVRLKDVARVELGARVSDVSNRFDGKPTVGVAIFLLSDANALETSAAVKGTMDRLSKEFPPGLQYEVGYDTAPFIAESITEVLKSLRDAILLVAIVVLVFLQSWRAAAIPLAAVPVAIVGTFAAMAAVGFTINNLTLFGLVLAVGIVVDDAIVVVEAVQHQLEKGYAPREATVRAMEQVTGPIIAVGVVLSAVFIPCAFLSGIVGQFFKQFALTIAVSTLISTFNSLTLSPALCALLLRGPRQRAAGNRFLAAVGSVFRLPFTLFNRGFGLSGRLYVRAVGFGLRVPLLVLAGYVGLVAAGVVGYRQLPTGFIPQQDKGYLLASIQLPDSASAERTLAGMNKLAHAALEYEVEVAAQPGEEGAEEAERDGQRVWVKRVRPVAHCSAVAGNSFVLSAYGSNFGSMFIILKGFEERRDPKLYSAQVIKGLQQRFAKAVPEAQVNVFGAPAVSRLGRAGGFRIMIEDRGDVGPQMLQWQTQNFIEKANQQAQVSGLFTVFKTNSPQVFLDVDRSACMARGVELSDVYATLQASMGSRYVNDFNLFGRTWQVNVQGDLTHRDQIEDIRRLQVRNRHGEMVPLGAVVRIEERSGPLVITRYNMYPAATVNGNTAPGVSTGDARALLERLADEELPRGTMGYEWSELAYIEKEAGKSELKLPGVFTFRGDTTAVVFGLSCAFVFLILAALYESWAFPLAVILVVPVCVSCSLAAVWVTDPGSLAHTLTVWNARPGLAEWMRFGPTWMAAAGWVDRHLIGGASSLVEGAGIRNQDVNIFTQVGFVVLVGLACKNAILIVEFAKVARDRGVELRTAVLDACKLRFRPIMMTSLAFILGVLPLAIATGAGSEMRQALGVAVLGGMVGVTLFGVVITPILFAVVDRLSHAAIFHHPWARAASDGAMYVLRLRFARPLAAAAAAKARRMVRGRFGT
jgi:multidrug efflux pump